MNCPDCNSELILLPDIEEKIWRCFSCRCEYSDEDLLNDDNFGHNPEEDI